MVERKERKRWTWTDLKHYQHANKKEKLSFILFWKEEEFEDIPEEAKGSFQEGLRGFEAEGEDEWVEEEMSVRCCWGLGILWGKLRLRLKPKSSFWTIISSFIKISGWRSWVAGELFELGNEGGRERECVRRWWWWKAGEFWSGKGGRVGWGYIERRENGWE